MEPDRPNDAELIAETLAGDREAFGQLYDRYAAVVRTVVAGVSGDWSGVDDMTQECFLRGYRKLAALRDPSKFGAWIAGVARQIGRERRRTLHRDRHEFRAADQWEIPSTADGQAQACDRDQLELVMRRVAELEERDRLAIHAYFLDERDAAQVAEMLGLSRSGMYALVQRAVARLAAAVGPCESREATGLIIPSVSSRKLSSNSELKPEAQQ
jgi:RNA polymerase sigma-70 factor (ECF subfamily)